MHPFKGSVQWVLNNVYTPADASPSVKHFYTQGPSPNNSQETADHFLVLCLLEFDIKGVKQHVPFSQQAFETDLCHCL